MIEAAEKTPAEQLREVIAAHRYSPIVMATPLGKVLPLVDAWVQDVERQIATLAYVQLGQHGKKMLHPGVWETLEKWAKP